MTLGAAGRLPLTGLTAPPLPTIPGLPEARGPSPAPTSLWPWTPRKPGLRRAFLLTLSFPLAWQPLEGRALGLALVTRHICKGRQDPAMVISSLPRGL